jgi:hypothetical protein
MAELGSRRFWAPSPRVNRSPRAAWPIEELAKAVKGTYLVRSNEYPKIRKFLASVAVDDFMDCELGFFHYWYVSHSKDCDSLPCSIDTIIHGCPGAEPGGRVALKPYGLRLDVLGTRVRAAARSLGFAASSRIRPALVCWSFTVVYSTRLP